MVIRVIRALIQRGMRLHYIQLCKSTTIAHMQALPGYQNYRICDPHDNQPDHVVFATLWRDMHSIQAFTEAHVSGVNWRAVTILPWEAGIVVSAVVSYVNDDYASLLAMGREVAPYVGKRATTSPPLPVTDAQWRALEPLLAPVGAHQIRRGRPRIDDRRVYAAVLTVIARGLFWRQIPLGVAPATGWRRYTEWERRGSWEVAWQAMLLALDTEARQNLVLDFLDRARAPMRRR
jgi:transposase